jgi:hypothetical protein
MTQMERRFGERAADWVRPLRGPVRVTRSQIDGCRVAFMGPALISKRPEVTWMRHAPDIDGSDGDIDITRP